MMAGQAANFEMFKKISRPIRLTLPAQNLMFQDFVVAAHLGMGRRVGRA